MYPYSNIRKKRRTGSILIAVLVLTAMISFIVLEFMEEATAKIKYFGLYYNRDDLRAEAYSMMDTALAVIDEIREIDGALHSPVQGWAKPLEYARMDLDPGLKVKIRVQDETGKLALSKLSPLTLNILFEEMGIAAQEADTLTDSLLDWIDEDDLTRLNGAESDYYERIGVDYVPPNEPIQSWEELRLIQGFDELFFDEDGIPNQYFNRFTGAISLTHDAKSNLNAARHLVLMTAARVEGFDQDLLYEYVSGEDRERFTADDRLINSFSNPYYSGSVRTGGDSIVSTQTRDLKVTVEVGRGEASFLLTAIVRWTGSNPGANAGNQRATRRGQTAEEEDLGASLGYPFEILRLTENFKI